MIRQTAGQRERTGVIGAAIGWSDFESDFQDGSTLKTDGYTLIMEANEGGVVWVPSHLDLTDVLIQRYNRQAKQGGGGSGKKSK